MVTSVVFYISVSGGRDSVHFNGKLHQID